MLGKNNIKEWLRKDQDNQQRFSIRKFTVGVTSVLLACTFLGVNPHIVKVDAAENVANAEVASSEKEAEDTQSPKDPDKSEEVTTREKENLQKYQEQNDTDSEKSTPGGPALVEGNKDKAQEQEQTNVNTVPEKDASKESIPKDKDIQDRQVKDNINSKQKSNVKNIDSQVIDKDIKLENLTDNKTENTKNTDLSKDATTTSKDKTDKLVEDTNDLDLNNWYKDRQNEDKFNVNDWNTQTYTGIDADTQQQISGWEITGYKKDARDNDISIPNTDDFIKAGIIKETDPKKYIFISRDTVKDLVTKGAKSITFHKSKDKNYDVHGVERNFTNNNEAPDGNSWANAFAVGTKAGAMDQNPYLKYVDVSGLDLDSGKSCQTKDMPELFMNDKNLVAVIGLENWNNVNPTNLGHLFAGCTNLKLVSDISNWNQKDKSQVKYIDNMFNGDKNLACDLDLSKWDVSHTIAMMNMFNGVATGEKSKPIKPIKVNISNWDFSGLLADGTGKGQNVFAGINDFAPSKNLVIIAQGIKAPKTNAAWIENDNLFADGQVVITDKTSEWLRREGTYTGKSDPHHNGHQDTYSFHGALDDNSDFTKAFNEAGKNQSHSIFYDVDEIGGQEVLDKTPVKIVESAIKAAIAENIETTNGHYGISNDVVNDISVERDAEGGKPDDPVTAANGTYLVKAPIVVKYIDEDGTQIGKVYETKDKDLIGKETTLNFETIKPGIPAGWVLDIDAIKTQYGDDPKTQYGDGYVEIKIKHGTKEIKPGQTIPKGTDPTKGQPKVDVKKTDSEHTLNRVITVTNPDGTKTPVTQSIDFNRTGHIDTVTGKVTWDDWTPVDSNKDSFASYTAPTIDGYTSGTVATKDKVTYTTGDPDLKANVGYTANDSNFNIIYKDDSGKEIGRHNVAGKTGGTIDPKSISNNIPAGWVTDNDKGPVPPLPSKFAPQDKQGDITVILKHGSVDVKPGDLPKPGDTKKGSGDNHKPGDGTPKNDITYNDLHKTITETVHYTGVANDKNPADNVQTVNYERTATIDNVDGSVTYSNWTIAKDNKKFASVTTPTVAGYTPDKNSVAAYAPTNNDITAGTNKSVTVTYTANKQSETIKFVDDDSKDAQGNPSKVGSPVEVDGVTDQTVDPSSKINAAIPAGYQLASGQTVPTSYTLKAGDNGTVDIHLVHGHKVINPGAKIPAGNTPSKGQPNKDVNPSDSQHTMTRTINLYKTDGMLDHTVTQTIDFERDGYIDEVTGDVHWNAWHPDDASKDSFAKVSLPDVAGYTADAPAPKVDNVAYNATDPAVINLKYKANNQSENIIFWDDTDNTQISTKNLTGTTDQTVNTGLTTPAGYVLAKGTDTDKYDIPATYKFKASGNTDIKVHFVHGSKDIKPGDVNPGDKVPGNHNKPGDNKPNKDVSYDDLHKTITNTITYTGAGSKDPANQTQTVNYERTAHVDTVNGNVTYSDWNIASGSFSDVSTPTVDGYKPDKDSVAAYKPSDDDITHGKNGATTVTYTAQPSSFNVHFVDKDGNKVNGGSDDQTFTGKTDDNVTTDTKGNSGIKLPAGWVVDTSKGAESTLPTKFVPSDKENDITVHVKHGTKTVTPGQIPKPTSPNVPGDNGHKKPGDGKPTNDITYNDLHKTIKEVITYTGADGHTPEANTQSIDYERTATIDDVTGDVSYSNWTLSDNTKKFVDVPTPTIAGYTPDKTSVSAYAPSDYDITAGKEDDVTVKYTANSQTITYQFHDDTDNVNVNSPVVVSGTTDQSVNTGLTLLTGYDLASGTSTDTDVYSDKSIPTSVKLNADNLDLGKTVTIHLVHYIDHNVTVDTNPKDSKTDAKDFSETITRTITAHEPQADGTFKDVDLSQHVTLTRTGDYDEVAKKIISWNPWNQVNFDAVNAPKLDGYTPDKSTVEAIKGATDGYVDPKIVITYTADNRQAKYIFVDDDNNGATVGDPVVVHGVTNQKGVAINLTVLNGYKLADGQTLPDHIDFGTSDPANVTIHLKHEKVETKSTDLTPDKPNHTDEKNTDDNTSSDVPVVPSTDDPGTTKDDQDNQLIPSAPTNPNIQNNQDDQNAEDDFYPDNSKDSLNNLHVTKQVKDTGDKEVTGPEQLNNKKNIVRPEISQNNEMSKAEINNMADNNQVSDAEALPQTGENNSQKLGLIGLALASLAGLFGIGSDRRKNN